MSTQGTRDRNAAMARFRAAPKSPNRDYAPHDDHRLERLIVQMPGTWQRPIRWLHQPSSRWARIPAGLLFIVGGCLAILPILGVWMIPLGLFLLAEDVPMLRRLRDRALDWMERRWPHWFASQAKQISDKEENR